MLGTTDMSMINKVADVWVRRKVVDVWSKRAISQKHIDKLMRKVETEDLPFDHLFQGKRRMAIDPEEYGGLGATQPSSASDIRQFLFNTEIVKSTDKIDWKKGLITDADGKVKSRLGKAIGKGVRKAMGKEAPLFRAMAKVEKERGKGTADTPIGRASRDYDFRGLIGFGKFVDPDFPAERAWKEMDTFGFPSPETWKEIKKVGDKFSKMSVEERKDVRDRHEAEYEEKKSQKVEGPRPRGFPEQSSMSPEYRNQYWAARGLYSSHIPQRVNDDGADMERWFRRWLDNTDDLYEGPEGEPLRQVFELSKGVPEERLKQLKQLSDLEQKKQEYALWKSLYGEDLSIVLSRDPVDVLRMSDHPKAVQAIESCHSEGGSEFSCAVEEAEEGGLVAYVVKKSDIEGKDLDEGELFEDPDRDVKGVKPYSRLRLRRFENDEQGGGLEVAVPETTVYGADFDNLVGAVTEWARKEQPEFLRGDAGYSKRPSDWRLTGGEYQDNPSSELFNNFFDREEDDRWGREPTEDEYDPYGEGYTLDDSPYYDPDNEDEDAGEAEVSERTVEPWRYTDRMTDFWGWMEKNYPKIPNPNPRGRKKEITPKTLKGYARGRTGYSPRAREAVGRYLAQYQEQKKEYAEARARGDIRALRVASRWIRSSLRRRADVGEDFWSWVEQRHPRVPNPNPNPEGREREAEEDALDAVWDRELARVRSKKKTAKYNPEFMQWAEQQRFVQPNTRNRVKFVSLPDEEQKRIYDRWRQMTQGEDAERVQQANRWLSTNEDPKRYDHIKFEIRVDEEEAEKTQKRLEQTFGTTDQNEIRNQILDLSGLGGVASMVESVDVLSWNQEYDSKIKVMGRGKHGLHFDRTLIYDETGDEEQPYMPSRIENNLFAVGKDAPAGVGTRMLASQVGAAEKAGFSFIETEASRSSTMNGYYTWPRLGFNASLTQEDLNDLEDHDPEAAWQVQQLAEADMNRMFEDAPIELFHVMAIPAARKWWEDEGHSVQASFSVSDDYDGGKSYQLLRAYTEAKAMAEGKTIPEYLAKIAGKKPGNMAPRLDKKDQQILDQVWEQARQRIQKNVKKKKASELASFWLRMQIVKSALGV